jgi:transcription-repair coupling factor (superfamily II helicase)
LDPVKRATKPRGVKKTAKRQPPPPSGRARGDALGLVDVTLASTEFQRRLAQDCIVLDHVTPQAFGFAAALMVRHAEKTMAGRRVWILCADVKTQDHVHAELGVWQCPALYFPRLGHVVNDALVDPELLAERAGVLGRMMETDAPVMVLCADSLDEPAPALAEISSQRRTLAVGARLDVEGLLLDLNEAGYERVPVVTERGQFARRGGIVDFFSWQAEEPLRLEFFDDEIESIRAFDLHNQSSIKRLDSAGVILQMSDNAEEASRVREHLRPEDFVVTIDCDAEAHARILSGASPAEGVEDFSAAIHENPLGVFDASDFVLHEARREHFARQIREWHEAGWRSVIFFHNEAERERFAELQSGLPSSLETKLGLLYRGFTFRRPRSRC